LYDTSRFVEVSMFIVVILINQFRKGAGQAEMTMGGGEKANIGMALGVSLDGTMMPVIIKTGTKVTPEHQMVHRIPGPLFCPELCCASPRRNINFIGEPKSGPWIKVVGFCECIDYWTPHIQYLLTTNHVVVLLDGAPTHYHEVVMRKWKEVSWSAIS
jgi:hypothetical protein